jgi:cytochrome c oxidase subunit 2
MPASASVADRPGVSGMLENGVRVVPMTARRYEFTPSRVVVNVGEKVKLVIRAIDTTHGFALPDWRIDVKLPRDKTTEVEFTAEDAGTHEFHCSVFCGPGHDQMKGELVVLPEIGPKQ